MNGEDEPGIKYLFTFSLIGAEGQVLKNQSNHKIKFTIITSPSK
jgi:hypothetical protein